jgi:hypothetical protein
MRFDLGPSLDALKATVSAKVDAQAEQQRQRYLTPGAGQALVYERKRAEAERMATDADPQPAAYPLLAAEVGITAPTLAEVGAVVRGLADQWTAAAAAIEAARLAAKAAIAAATTPPEVRAAADVSWP